MFIISPRITTQFTGFPLKTRVIYYPPEVVNLLPLGYQLIGKIYYSLTAVVLFTVEEFIKTLNDLIVAVMIYMFGKSDVNS